MRKQAGRWVLAEEVPAAIGGTVFKFLPTPRVGSKAELEDYLKQRAQDYAGRKVFVKYKERLKNPPRWRSGRRQAKH